MRKTWDKQLTALLNTVKIVRYKECLGNSESEAD